MMPTTKRGITVIANPYATQVAPWALNTVDAKFLPAAIPTDAKKRQMPISRSNRLADELV